MMINRIIFALAVIAFSLNGEVIASSPRGSFLDFVSTELDKGVANFQMKLSLEASDTSSSNNYHELACNFKEIYKDCFEGIAVPIPTSSMFSATFYSAANFVGQAFLKEARTNQDVHAYDIAIAWFKSTPEIFSSTIADVTDACNINFVKMAEQERDSLKETQQKLKELQEKDFSKLFNDE